jgi:FkbM family methyltransferase
MARMTTLMIGMPVRDNIHPQTKGALDRARVELRAAGIALLHREEPRGSLPLAHSLLAAAFLASDATHLLILHADVAGFTAEDIDRMLASGKDLIGAPLPGRSFNPERIGRALAAGVPPEEAWLHAAPQLWWETEAPRTDRSAIEVAAMSTGFLLMTRAAVEGAARFARVVRWGHERFAHVFEEDVDEASEQLMSEDKAFCGRCAMAGIACWADTKTSLVHWGEASFRALPLERALAPRLEPGPRRIPVAVRFSFACPTTCEAEARDILAGRVYDLPLDFDPALPPFILDLGANVGAFARFALVRWPGARVHCYEPQPGVVFETLRANMVTGMQLYAEAVVADDRDEVDFLVRPYQPTGSHVAGEVPELAGEKPIRVPACKASSLPAAEIVKIDIEGGEAAVLERYLRSFVQQGKHRGKTRGVIAEWHSEAARGELRALLEREGFEVLDERALRPDRPEIGVLRAVRPAA